MNHLLPFALIALTACGSASQRADMAPSMTGDLAALELTVAAQPDPAGGWTVAVGLSRPGDTPQRCYVAAPDVHVEVDGQPLARRSDGGPTPSGDISGAALLPAACAQAQFASAPGTRFADLPISRIAIHTASGSSSAEASVARLFALRHFTATPSGPVRAGERVTLRADSPDVWAGPSRSTAVVVLSPNRFAHRIDADAGLVVDTHNRTLTFPLPAVPPGPAQFEVAFGDLRPTPSVVSSRGLKACTVGTAAFASLPMEVAAPAP